MANPPPELALDFCSLLPPRKRSSSLSPPRQAFIIRLCYRFSDSLLKERVAIMSTLVFKKGSNQVYKPNMESRETFFAWLDQTRVRSSLKPTIPRPFRFRTKERSDLRASNAEKRAKQVEGKADSLKIVKIPNSREAVDSHLEKESDASVSMDVIPSATRVPELESETGQALPNQKTTVLCSDISISSGCEPVAAGANPCSAATPVRADSQQRTSIDLLNFEGFHLQRKAREISTLSWILLLTAASMAAMFQKSV